MTKKVLRNLTSVKEVLTMWVIRGTIREQYNFVVLSKYSFRKH